MVRALTLPNAVGGLNYLFNPDFGKLLSGKVWLEAFTQSAWSTGAGIVLGIACGGTLYFLNMAMNKERKG